MNRAAITTFCLLLSVSCGRAPPPGPRQDGQWVWSLADREVFARSRAVSPGLRPGIWVALIRFDPSTGELQQRLALPPTLVPDEPIAAVIRVDNSVHRVWDRLDDATIGRLFSERLEALLRLLDRSGADVAEIQLDYDCPTRRLARWATVVRALARGPLAGRQVWITSLLAHVRRPEYGDLFRGVVAGHILQVFDTGDEPGPALVDETTLLLREQRLPFRLGVGAYERVLPSGTLTGQRRWFDAVGRFRALPGYRGLWVFPAGRSWTHLRLPSP